MTMIRTAALTIAFLLVLELNSTLAAADQSDPSHSASGVQLTHGSEETGRLVNWAVTRFESAGLTLPAVEIQVHDDKDRCNGHLGLTLNTPDRVTLHLCTPGDGRGVLDRFTLLHELSHTWVAENVDARRRDQFMQIHGLETWWDAENGWTRQGVEWAAETIAWALFDEGVRMIGEVDNDPSAIGRGYETLTGRRVPDGSHDHSLAARASSLSEPRLSRRTDLDFLMGLRSLTLAELTVRWDEAATRRELPAGLPDWINRPGSVVFSAALTGTVELVAVTDGSGVVRVVGLTGKGSGQSEGYDTLLAWSLLLEALRPDLVLDIDAGRFDLQLVERNGVLRGTVHLP